MEFNATTFILEIVNFLILVWILKRFLYRPVLDVIAKRRQYIEDTLEKSRQLEETAAAEKLRYENRLTEWEIDSQNAKDKVVQEINEDRHKRFAELETELEYARKKAQVQNEKEREMAFHELELRALQLGAEFAARILAKSVGLELEEKLVKMFLSESAVLTDDQLSEIRQQWGEPHDFVTVSSAFPLSEQNQAKIRKNLSVVLDNTPTFEFRQKPELLAGLEVEVGPRILGLNIRDEMKGFAEIKHVTK